MKLNHLFAFLLLMVFTVWLAGCGSNVYKGLDSKSSADLKLCLDYGDYDCVINNTSDSDTGYLKDLRDRAKAGKSGFSLADVAAKAVNIDFSSQASASSNFTNLYSLTTGITDQTLFGESVKGLNDSSPTDANLQFTVAVENAMNVSIVVYSNFDTNKDGKLDVNDTALQNATTSASTWNTVKGSSTSYNSGVLGNVQASIDFINKAYASGATDASQDMLKAATDAQTQLNKISGATNTDILNGILCLDGGTKSDGSACS